MAGASGTYDVDAPAPSSEITSEQRILEAGNAPPEVTAPEEKISAREAAFSDDAYYDLAVKGIARALSVADTPFPTLSLPDTSYVDRGYNNLISQFDISRGAQTESLSRFKNASNEEIQARGEAANASIQANVADQQRSQMIADIATFIGKAFGTGANSEMIAQKAVLLERLEAEAFDRRTAIEQKQAVSLFDSPLEWIGNQLTLPGEIAAYNTFAGKTRGLRDDINNAIAASTNAENFAAKTVPQITTMQMDAKNRVDLAQGLILQKQTEERLAEKDYEFATKDFSNRMALQEESSRMADIEVRRATTEWQAKVEALKNSESEADRLLKIAEIGFNLTDRFKLGVLLESYDRITGKPQGTTSIASFTRFPKQAQEDIIGIAAGNPGTSPADSWRTFSRTNIGVMADPRLVQFMQMMRMKELEATQQQEYRTATGKEAQDNYIRNYQNQELLKMRTNPELDPKNNPFYQTPVGDVLRADPAFAASIVGKALEPISKGPMPPTTDQIIATLRANAPDNQTAAAMIAQYYAKNVSLRDRTGQFQLFGLKSDGTYNYTFHTPGPMFSRMGNANLTNPAQVLHMLNAMDVGNKMYEIRSQGVPVF